MTHIPSHWHLHYVQLDTAPPVPDPFTSPMWMTLSTHHCPHPIEPTPLPLHWHLRYVQLDTAPPVPDLIHKPYVMVLVHPSPTSLSPSIELTDTRTLALTSALCSTRHCTTCSRPLPHITVPPQQSLLTPIPLYWHLHYVQQDTAPPVRDPIHKSHVMVLVHSSPTTAPTQYNLLTPLPLHWHLRYVQLDTAPPVPDPIHKPYVMVPVHPLLLRHPLHLVLAFLEYSHHKGCREKNIYNWILL